MIETIDHLQKELNQRICVTRHTVSMAKGYLLRQEKNTFNVYSAIQNYIQHTHQITIEWKEQRLQGIDKQQYPVIKLPSREEDLLNFANYYIHLFSCIDAIWELIQANYFHYGFGSKEETINISSMYYVKTDYQDTSCYIGQDNFDFSTRIPGTVTRSYISRYTSDKNLYPDVELLNIHNVIPNANKEVLDALQDAVKCFRSDLFKPCLAVLGTALEGAWIELGLSIASKLLDKQKEKLTEVIKNKDHSISRKMNDILTQYNGNQPIFTSFIKQTGIGDKEFTHIIEWTSVIRESRNTIHFNTSSSMPISHETVLSSIISAKKHIKKLYKLKEYIDKG